MKKEGQLQLQAMWFAAGTAAFMACLERAVLVSVVEQWRAVVFLALNLLLLAILFTSPSTSPPPSATSAAAAEEVETEPPGNIPEAVDVAEEDVKCESSRSAVEIEEEEEDDDGDGDDDKGHELSEEEFNQRVEAFIATFRQHLVSDAKGQSCRSNCSSAGDGRHRYRGGIAMRL